MQLLVELEYDGGTLIVDNIFNCYKILVLRAPYYEARSLDRCHEIYSDVAAQIGELVPMEESLFTGHKTGDLWTDIRYDPNIENSYRHSNTRQPLHTDGSYESKAPNISFFYCIEAARYGGATTFLDSSILLDCLDSDLRKRLETTPVVFSKGNDSKERTIIDGDRLTWNYFRATKCEDPTLIEDFHQFLETRVVEAHMTQDVYLRSGDAVFFQDELLLHGRNAFFGNRWLKKGGVRWTEKSPSK